MVYLDHAATTPVCSAAQMAASEALAHTFGNPSSLYNLGLEATTLLESSRKTVATAMGASPKEIVFTGSGTEANNLAVLGIARARKKWATNIVATGYEHAAISKPLKALSLEGYEIRMVLPHSDGRIDSEELLSAVDSKTALLTAMAVNNETGATLDLPALATTAKSMYPRVAVHCDAIQHFGKIPFLLGGHVDCAAISAHKIGGPKGIGALYVKNGFHLEPLIYGGGQERGLRSGTENVAYAAAFAAAISELGSVENNFAHVSALNIRLRSEIAALGDTAIHSPENASPYILNVSLIGYKSEPLIHFLESREIYVSGGSACSRGKPSPTLLAMQLDNKHVGSALRISLSASTTTSDILALIDALGDAKNILAHR